MRLVALTGYARSGKDTVADYMVMEYGYEKRRFADPLKAMLRRLNPIVGWSWDVFPARMLRVEDLYDMYGDEEGIKASPYGDEARALWQRLGTDAVRAVDDQFWVRAAMEPLHPDGSYVFTDCRFPNEADAIRLAGGRLWNVAREGFGPVNGHVSEMHAGKMGEHQFIRNDATLNALYDVVDSLVPTVAPTAQVRPKSDLLGLAEYDQMQTMEKL